MNEKKKGKAYRIRKNRYTLLWPARIHENSRLQTSFCNWLTGIWTSNTNRKMLLIYRKQCIYHHKKYTRKPDFLRLRQFIAPSKCPRDKVMSIADPKNTRISNAVHHPAEAADFNRGRSGYEVGPLAHARPGSGAYQWLEAINICHRGVVPGLGLAQQAMGNLPQIELAEMQNVGSIWRLRGFGI